MPENSKRNRFNEIATVWDESPRRIQTANAVFKAILNDVPLAKEMNILDFGCGTGLVAIPIQPYVNSVTAVDNSAGMLNVLREKIENRKIKNIQTVLINDNTMSLPDEKFDLIMSSLTLHHIHDYQNLLSKMFHLLNPGAYICIADLEKEEGDFHDENTETVHHGFDPEILKENLTEIGYQSITYKRIYTITKETKEGKLKKFPLFLIIARNPLT